MGYISFRGTPYQAKKSFFAGTHRIMSPEETWEKIVPFTRQIGVTRVANITGLDRIGIPVTVAIRPKALTLSTSLGKGLDLSSSLVSGLMETLELHCAEEANLPVLHLPYQELEKRTKTIPISQLPFRKHSLFHPGWPEKWVLGWDLFGQEEVAVPLQSVILNHKKMRHTPSEIYSFQVSSNGLASGNHFLEALVSGIYEVIERDAITCHLFALESAGTPLPRVILETIFYPKVQQVIDQLSTKGFKLLLYDCTLDTAVPVYTAMIYDQTTECTRIAQGYGAHLDPEIAIIRAITEAVQGNTIAIAGSRDDMFLPHLKQQKQSSTGKMIRAFENAPATVDASKLVSEATPTLEEDVNILMEKLQKIGITQLIAFDLNQEDLDVAVLRVIIPGLEGYFSQANLQGRAKTFAAKGDLSLAKNLSPLKQSIHLPAGGVS